MKFLKNGFKSTKESISRKIGGFIFPVFVLFFSLIESSNAAVDAGKGLAGLANNISSQFPAFVSLIIAACYVAGMALAGAAILKFKAHKDNPTQVPLGTPIALLFIGAALLWLPSIIKSTGESVFNNSSQENLSGPGSSTWTSTP